MGAAEKRKANENFIKSDIKLTIGMLVSNHVQYIRNCMESIRPLLAAVPSELVVLDTKGEETDGSIAIVREYTDKIYPFTWCNDFSAARNALLSHASGEWFLYFDDDEWFDDVTEFIEFFQSGDCERYRTGMYYTRDYLQNGGWRKSVAQRMVRRTRETCFVGKIHEAFWPIEQPTRQFSCFTHHYGYVFIKEEDRKRHHERNLALLREVLAEEGKNARLCAEMVLELYSGEPEEEEESFSYCLECIRELSGFVDQERDASFQYLLYFSVFYYKERKDYVRMAERIAEIRETYRLSMAGQEVLAVHAVDAAKELGDLPGVCREAWTYLECREWLESHPEEIIRQMQGDFPTFHSEDVCQKILERGIFAANEIGNYEAAYRFLQKVSWEGKQSMAAWQDETLKTLRGLKDQRPLVEFYRNFYKEEYFLPENRGYLPKECREALTETSEPPSIKEMEEIRKTPVLTISLLVSNRIDTIRSCMESIRPLLAAVPSELIVVDTVGEENSDGALAVAKEYTDHIVRFLWNNDFAAARNAGLREATGEWFLFLDDDEWFEDTSEIIAFFHSGDYKDYRSASYLIRNYKNREGTAYTEQIGYRMVRREPLTLFKSKVHEYLSPYGKPNKAFSCFVHHYGYVYDSEEEKQRHIGRNIRLMLPELEKDPWDLHLRVQLLQEYMVVGRWEDAEILCKETLLGRQEIYQKLEFQWALTAYIRIPAMRGETAEVLRRTEFLRARYPIFAMTRLVTRTLEAEAAVGERQYGRGAEAVRNALVAYDALMACEEMRRDQSFLGLEAFLKPSAMKRLLENGISCCEMTGEEGQAKEWEKRKKELCEQEGSGEISRMEQSTSPAWIRSDIKLTIGMLVSNHVQYIRNCMESIRPLLAAVPSELVVLDTKGEETDGSIAIVREYTDKVYPFTWCNDFSAARNALLSHASGEWFLYFDDDEWFDDVTEFIEFFQSGECENYYSASYYTKDYGSDGDFSLAKAGRMIRRTADTRFVGRVHETFELSYGPRKQFSVFTHHYGYVYATEEDRKRKQERNLPLLMQEYAERGPEPGLCGQIVQELAAGGKDTEEEALCRIEEYLAALKEKGLLENSMSQYLLVIGTRIHRSMEKFSEGISYAEEIEKTYTLSKPAMLGLSAETMIAAAVIGRLPKMKECLSRYLTLWDWVRENPEEAAEQSGLDMPRYQTLEYRRTMLWIAAVAANTGRDYEFAYRCWQKIDWAEPGFETSQYKKELLTTLRGLEDREPLVRLYRNFYKEEYFLPENVGYLPRECREAVWNIN